jgi:hypothetical protein
MKNAVFWDVASCRSCEMNQRFRGLLLPAHPGSSLADFFYAEDRGDMFLQNVGSYRRIYTVPHPRRWHSSKYFLVPTFELRVLLRFQKFTW